MLFCLLQKKITFAPSFSKALSDGVKVALQILVLPV